MPRRYLHRPNHTDPKAGAACPDPCNDCSGDHQTGENLRLDGHLSKDSYELAHEPQRTRGRGSSFRCHFKHNQIVKDRAPPKRSPAACWTGDASDLLPSEASRVHLRCRKWRNPEYTGAPAACQRAKAQAAQNFLSPFATAQAHTPLPTSGRGTNYIVHHAADKPPKKTYGSAHAADKPPKKSYGSANRSLPPSSPLAAPPARIAPAPTPTSIPAPNACPVVTK